MGILLIASALAQENSMDQAEFWIVVRLEKDGLISLNNEKFSAAQMEAIIKLIRATGRIPCLSYHASNSAEREEIRGSFQKLADQLGVKKTIIATSTD